MEDKMIVVNMVLGGEGGRMESSALKAWQQE